MKSLYTVRWVDGKLMKFDGAAWSQLGSYAPANWNNGGGGNGLSSIFVYKGKMYAKYLVWDSTNSYPRLYISVFNGTDLSQVYTYPYNVSEPTNNNKFHTNVVEYKGMAIWLEIHMGTNPLRIYECIFKIDNAGTVTFTRRISEFSSSVQGPSERDNNTGNSGTVPMIIPHRDRLAVVPNTSTTHTSGGYYRNYWAYNASMEVDGTSGVITLTPFLTPDNTKRYYYMDHTVAPPTTLPPAYDTLYAHITSWKDYLYAITFEGKFYKVDPVSGTRTLIIDYSIDSNFAVAGGQTYVTDNTNSSYTFSFASTSSAGGYTAPWQNWAVGAMKVKILNYNGTANNTKYALMWGPGLEGGSWTGCQLYDFATGAKIATQPSATQFQCFWTWNCVGSYQEVFNIQNIYSVQYQGYLYIIRISSRRMYNSDKSSSIYNMNPPSVVIRYDGSTTPTVTQLTNGGNSFALSSASFEFDEAQGVVTLLGFDTINSTAKHYKIYLGATSTVQDIATPYSRSDTYNGANASGMNANQIRSYDYGDVTATIESRTSSVSARTVTITYKLWGVNSDTADVAIEHQLDSGIGGWKTCTRKTGAGEAMTGLSSSSAAAGSTHTFVQDMFADYPTGFTGSIQHRIRILSQTRN